MKKIISATALAVLFVCSVQTSKSSTLLTAAKSKHFISNDEREVSGFSGISSSGSFNIIITLGDKESLRLEGDPDRLSEIETRVEDGILKIRTKNGNKLHNWNWSDGKAGKSKVTIYITAKTLNTLTMGGSGDMKVDGTIKTEHLTTKVSGSGSISFNADVSDYIGAISGSGEINAKGSSQNAKVSISGSGAFGGKEFHSANADVKISGSGDASVYANQNLNASISGSGNIRYGGNPQQVSKDKSGSGRISKF